MDENNFHSNSSADSGLINLILTGSDIYLTKLVPGQVASPKSLARHNEPVVSVIVEDKRSIEL